MEGEDFVTAGSAEDDVVRNFMAVRFGKRSQETSVRKSWMERESIRCVRRPSRAS
jgi:hypothetical protein